MRKLLQSGTKRKGSLIALLIRFLLLGILLLVSKLFLNLTRKKMNPQEKRQAFELALKRQGITGVQAKMLMALALFETGNFKNSLSGEDAFNAWSMKKPARRPETSVGVYELKKGPNVLVRWQKYESYEQAIADLILWIRYNRGDINRFYTIKQFSDFLYAKNFSREAGYAEGLTKKFIGL
jgi:hypothetical protein